MTVRYLPAQEGIPALITGQEQIAGIGGADAASAEAQGAKLKLVATLTPTYHLPVLGAPALRQRRAPSRASVSASPAPRARSTPLPCWRSRQLGLTTSDVTITPLGGVTNVNSSLLAGSVAAAASHPPATYQFQRAGLVDLVDLAKKKIPSVSAGLWVTQSYLEAHRDVVQDVVDAIVEAFQREKSDRAFAENEMSKHLGIKDKGELDFTYDFYINEVLAAEPMPEVAQIQSNIEALSASNPKVKSVDAAAMVDQSFVKNAEKQQAEDEKGTATSSSTSSQ